MAVEYNDTMEELVDPVEITSSTIFLAIGIPTVFIYLRILMHFCSKGFKTQFHRLFLVCITTDALSYFVQLFTIRLPTWGIIYPYRYIMTGFMPTLLNFLLDYVVIVQIYGVFLMALNRATCILLSYSHERIWRDYFKYFLLTILIVSFIETSNLLFAGAYFKQYGKGMFVITAYTNDTRKWFLYLHLTFGVIGIGFSAALNCFNGYYIIRHVIRKKKSQAELQDLKFHFTTFFAFIVQVLMVSIQVFIKMTSVDSTAKITLLMYVVYTFQPVFNDLASLLPIWFVIYISEDFRWMAFGNCGAANRDADGNTIMISTVSIESITNKSRKQNSGILPVQ